MKMKKAEKTDSVFVLLIKILYIVCSYFLCDALLRVLTRWLGYYSIYELPPSLFSLAWIGLIVVFLSLLAKKAGRILYGLTFYLFAILSLTQYGYYLIFDKFLFIADLQYAGEGGEYTDFVLTMLNNKFFLSVALFIVVGILGIIVYPDFKQAGSRKLRNVLRIAVTFLSVSGIVFIPNMYRSGDEGNPGFNDGKYEYRYFTNSGFDMELTGLYQYVAKDIWRTFLKPKGNIKELRETADAFFEKAIEHPDNEMTGILAGKNIIVVQMESVDDWLLNEDDAPTIMKLMNEGINFENFYTCMYGSGSTFATEFAVNTGSYQSLSGVAAYSMMQNHFMLSLPNIFKNLGYNCNSFHENNGSYYNREQMHKTFGYEHYYCTRDILGKGELPEDDETIASNDRCWNLLTGEKPFFDFIVSYSAHVPYTADNKVSVYASEKHPEITNDNEELKYLYSKVRLTDDLFRTLLEKLEQDGLLENTVIIGYADHYCYGISDKELVRRLSKEKGSSILEKTPLFIWYKGCSPLQVTKTCQTVDLLPTIANMYGIDLKRRLIGNDIFNLNYRGYAIFPNGTWISAETYVRNGEVVNDGGMSEEEILKVNEYVKDFYTVNEAILDSDYYSSVNQ